MQRAWRVLLLMALAAAGAAGVWAYAHWSDFQQWWAAEKVGAAASFEAARAELAWFETGPDRDQRLLALVEHWGRGKEPFDLYLARYVCHPDSSERLRMFFSRELAWREELLPRWAQYWSWQAKLEPDSQIASILDYLHALSTAQPARALTWREVLDFQAILQLMGHPSLAIRLSPDNWRDRYQRWLQARWLPLRHVARPKEPLGKG
jgi:hypothetical protein